jgi:uncharacterized circularly permuted ATP-grasp superfamily protein
MIGQRGFLRRLVVILEDNLRVPSGASYPLSIRDTYRKIYPDFFEISKKSG